MNSNAAACPHDTMMRMMPVSMRDARMPSLLCFASAAAVEAAMSPLSAAASSDNARV